MRIGWIVSDLNVTTASTRYRCYYPALALSDLGHENDFFRHSEEARTNLDELDAVVFVKRVDGNGPRLANEARLAGKHIFIDLCDNIVVSSYPKKALLRPTLDLVAAAAIADAVVTTSSALSAAMRPLLPALTRFLEIPDQIETAATYARASDLAQRVAESRQSRSAFPIPLSERGTQFLEIARNDKTEALHILRRKLLGARERGMLTIGSTKFKQRGLEFMRLLMFRPQDAARVVAKTEALRILGHKLLGARKRAMLAIGSIKFKRRGLEFMRLLVFRPQDAARIVARNVAPGRFESVGQVRHAAAPPVAPRQATAFVTAATRIPTATRVAQAEREVVTTLAHAPSSVEANSQSRDCGQSKVGEERKVVLWFGNYGAPHSDFGMLGLLQAVPALERVAGDISFELLVISNSRALYDTYIAPLNFPSRYVEWSASTVFDALAVADVCIFPFGHDAFSTTKSANRPVLSLHRGVPVISTRLGSLEPLAQAIVFDDWEAGLRLYLGPGGSQARAKAIALAAPILERLYFPEAIGRCWATLLSEPRRRLRYGLAENIDRTEVGVLINLPQDLDAVLPVIDELRRRRRVYLRLMISPGVVEASPRVLQAIVERGIVPFALDGAAVLAGEDRILRDLDSLLTASETSLSPHKIAHALTETARGLGVRTYTLQHGVENVGLTYADALHGRDVAFAADRVLTWGDPRDLPSWVLPSTRDKAVAVGRPNAARPVAPAARVALFDRPVLGVFENLHWHRFTEAYRADFVADLLAVARAHADIVVLVKPHHSGRYLVKNAALLSGVDNVVIANPLEAHWEPYTAPALIPLCFAVVTTPSTVALDAAELDIPVAVARYDLKLDAYTPLPELASTAEWQSFVRSARASPASARAQMAAWRDKVCIPGDAASRIADILIGSAAGSPESRSQSGASVPAATCTVAQ